ncbi:NlpC/P60 family protein [Haloechinothrix salitolerans]|uniref:NlpC/P60 family protein n=1 Tax=Haloechinothrix salitolerans TaxID=926830 RepID=A0ABW2C019_9PSEU
MSAQLRGGERQRGGGRPATAAGWVAAVAASLAFVLGASPAVAVPPPPPNPSDSELKESKEAARERASEVGQLTNQLAEAESKLTRLQNEVARKLELANKARVDAAEAADAAARARRDAKRAREAATTAGRVVDVAREETDEFVAGSYQQGSKMGSLSAYVTSSSPEEVLLRAQLLEAVSSKQLDALDDLQTARVKKSNADAAARKAVEVAEEKRREAEQAKQAAREAYQAAVDARASQASRAEELGEEREAVQQALYRAQREVKGLENQRERYQEWLAAKREEEAQQAQQAAAATAPAPSGGSSAPASPSVETVISRAMSQLGVPYAWGGGNTQGPTYGIRDYGVADSFGDYNKIGFDCSGLMIYAFAGVKTLPHYSGYQYESGRKVPLSQMRRGDMLFWGTAGIHHVALYLGDGMMIEAPQSGMHVRVTPVRYGDILPYAVRLIG